MDTIKTTIAMWQQFQRPGWDVKFASSEGVLIFEVPSTYALYKITILCIDVNTLFQAFVKHH